MSTKEGAESGGGGGSMCLNTAVLLWVVIQYLDQYLQNSEPKTQPQRAGSSTQYANLLFLFSVYVRAKLLTVSLELRTENYEQQTVHINRVCHFI